MSSVYDIFASELGLLINPDKPTTGYLGFEIGGVFQIIASKPTRFYVHFDNNAFVEALNIGRVPPEANRPVELGYTAGGKAVILGDNLDLIEEYLGQNRSDIGIGWHTHDQPPLLDLVSDYRFRPGMIRAYDGTLSVFIEPFNYIYNRVEYRFPGGPYIFAEEDIPTSGKWWVKIYYNMDTTNFVVSYGSELVLTDPDPSLDDLATIQRPDGYNNVIPIGGCILHASQTTPPPWREIGSSRSWLGQIDDPDDDDLKDVPDVAGSYTNANVTIDEKGRVTAAENGTDNVGLTSVGLVMPAEFSVASSPLTVNGDITVTKADQAANKIYAGPTSGADAPPAFRDQILDDLPAISTSKLLGRSTAGTGKPEEITIGSGLDLTGGVLTSTGGGLDAEAVQDMIATFLIEGANVDLTYDDVGNTLTIAVTGLSSTSISDFNEAVDDRVSALVVAGTNISSTYNDASNTLTIAVTGIIPAANGGLGADASAFSGLIKMSGGAASVATANTDYTNPIGLDLKINEFSYKAHVHLATTAALPACTYNNGASGVGATLTGNSVGAFGIDSVNVLVGYRIYVKDQVDAAQNGIYVVTVRGDVSNAFVFTRATDHDTPTKMSNSLILAGAYGTDNAYTLWYQPPVVSVGVAGPIPVQIGITASGTFTLSNKTLVTPTIASFANANHNHTNSAGGGQLTDAALSAPVSAAKGGTALNTSASTGFPRITSGTWSVGSIAPPDISGFDEAVDDRVDALTLVDAMLSKTYNDASNTLTLGSLLSVFQARLTLSTGVAVPTGDITAATEIFLTSYGGNLVAVYNGTRTQAYVLASDISVKITNAQSGTTTNGNKIISGLTDTSQLVVGMKVSGTGVGAAAVISTIDSPTQVTVSVNSTSSATNTITFKCPANTMYDMFVYVSSGSLKLEINAWSSLTARVSALQYQDGYLVKNSTPTRRFAGCFCTTATDGQTERSHGTDLAGSTTASNGGKCLVTNFYNTLPFGIRIFDNTAHLNTNAAYQAWHTNANAFVAYISCNQEFQITASVQFYIASAAAVAILAGGTIVPAGGVVSFDQPFVFFTLAPSYTAFVGSSGVLTPRLGYNTITLDEYGGASITFNSGVATTLVPA